jgi:hypothetical protein
MTEAELQAIEWRLTHAGGPCKCEYDGTGIIFRGREHVAYVSNHQGGERGRYVTKFIAASFSDVPALVAEVRRLRSQRDELLNAMGTAMNAMNPPDMGGISLHVWNNRLKAATVTAKLAIDKASGIGLEVDAGKD